MLALIIPWKKWFSNSSQIVCACGLKEQHRGLGLPRRLPRDVPTGALRPAQQRERHFASAGPRSDPLHGALHTCPGWHLELFPRPVAAGSQPARGSEQPHCSIGLLAGSLQRTGNTALKECGFPERMRKQTFLAFSVRTTILRAEHG